MAPTHSPPKPPARDRLTVTVPARGAEGLQTRFRRCGIGSTLYWQPYDRDADLEIWPGADPALVERVLAEYWAAAPSPR